MRLLLVAEDPSINGGIPLYAVPVAEELVRRGWEVDYLFGGGYTGRYDWRLRAHWTTFECSGVHYHGLVNARSIGVNSGHPLLDVDSEDVRLIEQRGRKLGPSVVHVHSLLGMPVRALEGLSEAAPVVLSVHDFGLICQRRVLVQRDRSVCTTYTDQVDCPSCLDRVDTMRYRMRARLAATLGGAPLRAVHRLERATGHDASVTVSDGESETDAVAPYRARLERSVGIVNARAARVLAVSRAVRQILIEVGVRPDLVEVVHIGSGSAAALRKLPLPSSAGAPVTFLYLGGLAENKGAHVLMDALSRLPESPPVLIAGRGNDRYEAHLRERAPASVTFLGPYEQADLPNILGRADVVVAPTVGPDTSPQTVLEALAAGRPVVGSRIGGIPDFVEDGVNGKLFEPGDAGKLAELIHELSEPARVEMLAGRVEAPRSLKEHVNDLEALYADLR